jgi:serine/threonine-protein kinase
MSDTREGPPARYEPVLRLHAYGFMEYTLAWVPQRQRHVLLAGAHCGRDWDAWMRETAVRVKQLHQRSLPALVETATLEEGIFQVWELEPGLPLRRLLDAWRQRPASLETCLWIARELAGALAAAHGAGLTHGLLEPEAVWLTPEGDVRLLFLGFGKVIVEGVRMKQQTSTWPPPMDYAPEFLLGKAMDARSDVYGLGWLLYRLLWGHPPFRRGSAPEQLQAILHEPVAVPVPGRQDVPEGLGALVLRMLAKDPALRPVDGAEALAALDAFHGPPSPPSELKQLVRELAVRTAALP